MQRRPEVSTLEGIDDVGQKGHIDVDVFVRNPKKRVTEKTLNVLVIEATAGERTPDVKD